MKEGASSCYGRAIEMRWRKGGEDEVVYAVSESILYKLRPINRNNSRERIENS